jgi:transcriptional regulator GlxA family with amidase domain
MRNWHSFSEQTENIGILLFDRFSNHCLANVVEPLRAANELLRRPAYRWSFLTIEGGLVTSSSGMPVLPEGKLSDADGGSCLFVQPSYEYRRHATPQTSAALRAASHKFKRLAGLDTGSWLLAHAGLLDGQRATIHWDVLVEFEEAFPKVDVSSERYVVEARHLSCGGAMTAFDMVLELIARRHGEALRLEVAAFFMQGDSERDHDPMRRSTGSDLVDRAVALMRVNLETPVSMPDLARQTGCSQRQMEALFRARLGTSPKGVYKRLRLLAARRYAEQTRYSIAEIAVRCGYVSASSMTRAFVEEFGAPPTEYRKN